MTLHHFDEENETTKSSKTIATPAKMNFLLGLFAGMAILSTLTLLFVLPSFVKKDDQGKVAGEAVNANTNVAPTPAPTPSQDPEEPQADPSKLSPFGQGDYVKGNKNAQVQIIEFSDFECPYCARHYDTMKQVAADYGDKVGIAFRQFPLSFHPEAEKAAEASECAGEQGKFWEMHDKLFAANQAGTMSVDKWKEEAKNLGLDTAKFNDCLDSGKYASTIRSDMAEGEAAGVQGTPATFINGQLVSGAIPYESIKQIIDSYL